MVEIGRRSDAVTRMRRMLIVCYIHDFGVVCLPICEIINDGEVRREVVWNKEVKVGIWGNQARTKIPRPGL